MSKFKDGSPLQKLRDEMVNASFRIFLFLDKKETLRKVPFATHFTISMISPNVVKTSVK